MPHTISPRRARSIAAALIGAATLIGGLPAVAGAACSTTPTSTPFKQFGDTASYSLVQGGLFEAGAPGWTLSHAAVKSGGANGGSHSLAIEPDGYALSPAVCVDIAEPSFRFFARQTSGSWAVLNVVLQWSESSGTVHDTTVAALQTGTSWTLSPVLKLASTLPLWESSSTISVRLLFKPEPYGGGWAIDDVYVDPYSR